MSIFGKLKFWKRDDDLSLGNELAMPKSAFPQDELGLQSPGLPQAPQMPLSEPRMESFQEPQRSSYSHPYAQQQQQYYGSNRDLDLVVAKLDALRATLENINQRLANLERVAYGEEDNKRRGW